MRFLLWEVRPLSNIRQAEARRIEALCTLFALYELPLAGNTLWLR